MANNITEELFGAVDTIIKKRLQALSKDTTILCEIQDNTNAEDGQYVVSNSGIRFTAYSDKTDYTIGESVWVLIPDGNYENTKLIMGKYVSTDSSSFTYVDPFLSFIEMTDNLCGDFSNIELGLTANEIDEGRNPYAQVKPYNNGGSIIDSNVLQSLQKITTIGVSADFKTTFSTSNQPIAGTYGLHFDVMTDAGRILPFDLATNGNGIVWNIYGSKYYNKQTKTFDFDPDEVGNIISINCSFFQNADFITNNGMLPYKDAETGNVLNHNIWVKNLQIKLGYSTNKIKNTTAFLWTSDSLSFDYSSGMSNNYVKVIHPRLAYKYGTGKYKLINNLNDFKEFNKYINDIPRENDELGEYPKIKFYKYDSSSSYNDPRAGASWIELEQTNQNDIDNFQLTVQLDNKPQESFKALFIFKDSSKYTVLSRLNKIKEQLSLSNDYDDDDITAVQLVINAVNSGKYTDEDIYAQETYENEEVRNKNCAYKMSQTTTRYEITSSMTKLEAVWTYISWVIEQYHTASGRTANYLINNDIIEKIDFWGDNATINFEKAKSTLEKWYESDVLTFKNSVTDDSLIKDLIQGLRLTAVDDKKGVYNIYKATENTNSELIKSSDTFIKRNIEASFISSSTQEEEFDSTDRIYWLIPRTISMIKDPINGLGFGEYYNIITINEKDFDELKTSNVNNGDMCLYTYESGEYIRVTQTSTYSLNTDYYIKSKSYLITENEGEEDLTKYIKSFSTLLRSGGITSIEENFLRNNINNFWVILEDRTEYTGKRAKKAMFMYQIKPIYRKSLTNNKIYAAIYKDQQLCTASIELYFGVKGLNGAGYTLTIAATGAETHDPNTTGGVINLDFSPNCWILGWTQWYRLQATVYDSDDNVDTGFIFTYTWLKQWAGFTMGEGQDNGPELTINTTGNTSLDGHVGGIIKCTASKGNIYIEQYYVIPVCTPGLIDHIDGATSIVYDNNGINPEYQNTPYAVKDSDDKIIQITNISREVVDSNEEKYLPVLDANKTLIPAASFVNDINYNFYIKIVTNSGTWYQPIAVVSNNYGNSKINSLISHFDDLLKDTNDTSTISSIMSSVSVDTNNKVTGIVIGSLPMVGSGQNARKRSGVLGYKVDQETFGLFDDGTALINFDQTTIQGGLTIADIYWGGNRNNKVTKNLIFAGPTTGNAATPIFRALDGSDLADVSLTELTINGVKYTISAVQQTGNTYNLVLTKQN